MKKTHTFKNYEVAGIEDTYNLRIKVDNYKLIIEELTEEMKVYNKNLHLMNEPKIKISKEEAEKYIELFMQCELELE